jgi:hypothetical protein
MTTGAGASLVQVVRALPPWTVLDPDAQAAERRFERLTREGAQRLRRRFTRPTTFAAAAPSGGLAAL